MKRLFSLMVVAMVALCSFAAWTPETLPVPKNTTDSTKVSYVSNPDGVLSSEEVRRINQIMFNLEKNQGVRGLVIAVKEIEPDDPYEFTIGVGNRHGIGGKSNTGFIVMVASVSRAYEIMPGDGMEKFLTDGMCSSIGRNDMVPFLKEGKWGEAVLAAVQRVADVCSGEDELKAEEDGEGSGSNAFLWIMGGFAAVIGYCMFSSGEKRECPKCKQKKCDQILRYTFLSDGDDAPTKSQIEESIQSKLLAMKMQKDPQLVDKVRLLANANASASSDSALVETEDKEQTVVAETQDVKPVVNVAEAVVQSSVDADGTEEQSTNDSVEASAQETDDADVLKMAGIAVTPAVAAAALKIFESKKAPFDDALQLTKEQKAKMGCRHVRLIDVYECKECGNICRVHGSSNTQRYKLGLFTFGSFGAITAVAAAAASSGGRSSRTSSGSGSSYHRSSGSSHSWGSSGGGHFGGGGAGGRF